MNTIISNIINKILLKNSHLNMGIIGVSNKI